MVMIAWFVGLLLFLGNPSRIFAADPALAWETEWERTVRAAEQEGQLVYYKLRTGVEYEAFQKKYPKIKVMAESGRASQLLQRITAERRAGKYLADVIRVGGGSFGTLVNAKIVDPIAPALILPEVIDPSKWFEGKHHFNDAEGKHVFIYAAFPLRFVAYNTQMVDPKTLTSMRDLLDPRWKGKITLKDPRDPGGGSPLLYLYYNPRLGPEFIRKLLQNSLTLVRDERQQIDWLASGKYPVALTAKADDVDEAKRQGLPVTVMDPHAFRKDGVGLEAGGTMIGLVNRAPHPNAARVFLNWFLSREGQIALQKGAPNDPGPNSLREDIPKDDLPAYLHRQKGVNYTRLWGPEVWDRDAARKFVTELVK
ncbi:MAG: ABC transporter substrate-binding protein [Candidatus Binatia bacterium]